MIKLIIFDYDGVVVDSFSNIHEVYQTIAKEFGVDCPENVEDFRKLYGYNLRECNINLGIPIGKELIINQIFNREILKKKPKLFEGIDNVIKKLSEKYELVLLSSNFKEEIASKTRKFDLKKYFSEIIGKEGDNFIRKSEIIPELLKERKITIDEVIFIGDRDNDWDACKKIDLQNIILVNYGWGHTKQKEQDFQVDSSMDILKAVKQIDHP